MNKYLYCCLTTKIVYAFEKYNFELSKNKILKLGDKCILRKKNRI